MLSTQSNTYLDLTSEVLDVRDIIERFEHIENTYKYTEDTNAWDEDDLSEYKTLEAILDDLKGNGGDEQWRGDWYPVSLIHESYFTEYMTDLIKDCYSLDVPHFVEVDWEATADNCKVDYTFITIKGTEYWYR